MATDKKIWIYGKHAVIAALLNKKRKIYNVVSTSGNYVNIKSILKERKLTSSFVTNKELDLLLGNAAAHQGIALETETVFSNDLGDIFNILKKDRSLIVILDQLTDPQNIGNIIRSAHAFNADAILTPKNNSFSETSSLAKAACGAIDNVPVVFITNLASTIKILKDKGYWIVGLDSSSENHIHEFKFSPKTALILGAEGVGLRELTKKNCDFLLKIKMNTSAESINASNACAIAMYNYFTSQI